MSVPEQVLSLVERYTNNRKQYISLSYKEADVRVEFLDSLFRALGWDLDNKQGHAPQYREVITEESLEVEGSTKSPDYSFRIGGITKFFVEAKKPSVDICTDKIPAFQLKRYAWSAKLPLSILINFEDISVYDCRFKPVKTDDPTKGRILHIPFTELLERWDELTTIFTKEAILTGSFDKYAQERKRGTSEVDVEILKEIESWRKELAKNIARKNELNTEEVNFAVQRLIDRILFLRICEDRGTEPENQLYNIWQNKRDIYKHLMVKFEQADAKYNSGLFHFLHDKKRSTKRDVISPYLKVDDKVLASILWDLYYPNSPYQFDVIPADILGQVYEQFLGKVISLSPSGKTATVEEKPEVKKAGGVYYTPTYIVEYIVNNTVVKLCENKTPEEIANIKILDPACGSGSFLIVAYQRLLDYHLEWYLKNNPKKWPDQLFQRQKDFWQLTLQEKKRILLNNIHGVDIDSQAVEVTKLNLLLKALEGENKESLDNFGKWFREPALPDLGSNVKCGNSLIDFDIIDHLQDLSDDERDSELGRINPFSWQEEFSDIMKAGGFDVVVGNPPYIRIQTMKEWAPVEVEHYKRIYQSASKGNYDIYVVFIEKALQLINKDGKMGYICPHKFFQAKYGLPIRKLIGEGKYLDEIVHFGDLQVFSGATTYTCLLFMNKVEKANFHFIKVSNLDDWRLHNEAIEGDIKINASNTEWNFVVGPNAKLFERLDKLPVKLLDISDRLSQGIRTSANEVYVLEITGQFGNLIRAYSKQLDHEVTLEKDVCRLFLKGRDIKPYQINPSNLVVIMPYLANNDKITLIPENELKKKYPNTHAYLNENKTYLENRERGRMKGSNWYGYIYPKNIEVMSTLKILVPDIANKTSFALDDTGQYTFVSGYCITLKECTEESYKYILGLLNCSLTDFYLKQVSTRMRGGFFKYETRFIKKVPIRTIDFSDPDDKARHDKMVKLVERMLKLHKDVKEASMPDTDARIQRQILAADREIDALVYELYGLTDEEINIIEGE